MSGSEVAHSVSSYHIGGKVYVAIRWRTDVFDLSDLGIWTPYHVFETGAKRGHTSDHYKHNAICGVELADSGAWPSFFTTDICDIHSFVRLNSAYQCGKCLEIMQTKYDGNVKETKKDDREDWMSKISKPVDGEGSES